MGRSSWKVAAPSFNPMLTPPLTLVLPLRLPLPLTPSLPLPLTLYTTPVLLTLTSTLIRLRPRHARPAAAWAT